MVKGVLVVMFIVDIGISTYVWGRYGWKAVVFLGLYAFFSAMRGQLLDHWRD